MGRLPICRVCLTEGVRLILVVDTHLQETYESVTFVPFDSRDRRPLSTCYICYAKLKNCYEFRRNSLRSERLLTQILNGELVDPVKYREVASYGAKLKVAAVLSLTVGQMEEIQEVDATVRDSSEALDEDLVSAETEQDFESTKKTEDVNQLPDTEDEIHVSTAKGKQSDIPTNADVFKGVELAMETEDSTSLYLKENEQPTDNVQEVKENNLNDVCSDQSVNSKNIQCDICLKNFKCTIDFTKHSCTHSGEKTHQCDICMKCFKENTHLVAHIRRHLHKKYQCTVCKKRFSSECNLGEHIYFEHSNEKPYEYIYIYDKYFSQTGDFDGSMAVNIEEKHQCNACKKCFGHKKDLLSHVRSETVKKLFECDVCKKYFKQKCHLDSHIRTHIGEKSELLI